MSGFSNAPATLPAVSAFQASLTHEAVFFFCSICITMPKENGRGMESRLITCTIQSFTRGGSIIMAELAYIHI